MQTGLFDNDDARKHRIVRAPTRSDEGVAPYGSDIRSTTMMRGDANGVNSAARLLAQFRAYQWDVEDAVPYSKIGFVRSYTKIAGFVELPPAIL